MGIYDLVLANSQGVTGSDHHEFADDERAVCEARRAAGEAIADELAGDVAKPQVTVTVTREGKQIAEVRVVATVDRTAT